MFELFSLKSKCTSKTYAMTNNVKYILPWNPVYKKGGVNEGTKNPIDEKSSLFFQKNSYKLQQQ
jgi:hypothetical protein